MPSQSSWKGCTWGTWNVLKLGSTTQPSVDSRAASSPFLHVSGYGGDAGHLGAGHAFTARTGTPPMSESDDGRLRDPATRLDRAGHARRGAHGTPCNPAGPLRQRGDRRGHTPRCHRAATPFDSGTRGSGDRRSEGGCAFDDPNLQLPSSRSESGVRGTTAHFVARQFAGMCYKADVALHARKAQDLTTRSWSLSSARSGSESFRRVKGTAHDVCAHPRPVRSSALPGRP